MTALLANGAVKKYGFSVCGEWAFSQYSSHPDTFSGDAAVLNYTFGVDTVALVELQDLGKKLHDLNAGIQYFCGRYFERFLTKELDAGSSWRDELSNDRQNCELQTSK